jgi:uncharacterized membrane protein YkgB
LVANSPLMSFFYADPGHYKAHINFCRVIRGSAWPA